MTNPFASPANAEKQEITGSSRSIWWLALAALIFALLNPYPVLDLFIGGLVGSLFARPIGKAICYGYAGAAIAMFANAMIVTLRTAGFVYSGRIEIPALAWGILFYGGIGIAFGLLIRRSVIHRDAVID